MLTDMVSRCRYSIGFLVTALSACETAIEPAVDNPGSAHSHDIQFAIADEPCEWAYKLMPVDRHGVPGVAVIYIHGWQHDLDTCSKWQNFNAEDQGARIFEALNNTAQLQGLVHYWRYSYASFNSIETAAVNFAELVRDSLPATTHLVLIGHSMGGLVARRVTQLLDSGSGPFVDRVITLGTPHRGTDAARPKLLLSILRNAGIDVPNLNTAGAMDLHPRSDFLNITLKSAPEDRKRVYSIIGTLPTGVGECGHFDHLCTLYRLMNDWYTVRFRQSDGLVPDNSAAFSRDEKRNFFFQGYDHTELRLGDFRGQQFDGTDGVLPKVAQLVAEVVGVPPLLHFPPVHGGASVATAVNDRMEVVGEIAAPNNESKEAFYWSRSSQMIRLGTRGTLLSSAVGINKWGVVAGNYGNSYYTLRAFRWTLTDGMTDLPIPENCHSSRAAAINNDGYIVGTIVCTGSPERAVRWAADGEITVLPLPRNAHESSAVDINARGDILLVAGCFGCQHRSYIYKPGGGFIAVLRLTSGPELPYAVNLARSVVGSTNSGWGPNPVVWTVNSGAYYCDVEGGFGTGYDIDEAGGFVASTTTRGWLCQGEDVRVLPPLWGRNSSIAFGMNPRGDGTKYVVGASVDAGSGNYVATVWVVQR